MGPLDRAVSLILCAFLLGIVASLFPAMSATAPRTAALLEGSGALRRVALVVVFALGLVTILTPFGFAAAVSEEYALYTFWTPVSTVVFVAALAALAASMFGLFGLRLPASLVTKLDAVGDRGVRGVFARGLVVALLAFPVTFPFALALIIEILRTGMGHVVACTLSFAVFAIGLAASTAGRGLFGWRLPAPGRWTEGLAWLAGVGFGCAAFVRVHERVWEVSEALRSPTWTFGLASGALLVAGLAMGGASIVRDSRRLRALSAVPAIAGACLFGNWLPHPHGNAPQVRFSYDEPAARAAAVAEERPVLIVFNATWCCSEIDHDMLFDPRVREAAQGMVPIYVDASDSDLPETRRLLEKYRVLGLPTTIVLDRRGQEVARFSQLVPGDELARQMHRAAGP
jgi:thiol:disulfide interchange protein DsbD